MSLAIPWPTLSKLCPCQPTEPSDMMDTATLLWGTNNLSIKGGGGGDRYRIRFQVDRSERVGDRGSDVAGLFVVWKGRLQIWVQHAVGGREDT
eukprot:scaffold20985_cov221-Amphora_coffeaeformis.AAC.4